MRGLCNLNVLRCLLSFPRQNKNIAGLRETLVKEFIVHPKYSDFFVPLVTIVIPVEKSEKTDVKVCFFFIFSNFW